METLPLELDYIFQAIHPIRTREFEVEGDVMLIVAALAVAFGPVAFNVILGLLNEFFTYVTKTIANLTTYRRKTGEYNGTIIFEIDIMKNSSPINLNLCRT